VTTVKKSVEKGGTMVGKTNVVHKNLQPVWDLKRNRFVGEMPGEGGCLLVEVLYACCTHTVFLLYSYCTLTVLILYSYCTNTVLILY
jgi:hypothetical protein